MLPISRLDPEVLIDDRMGVRSGKRLEQVQVVGADIGFIGAAEFQLAGKRQARQVDIRLQVPIEDHQPVGSSIDEARGYVADGAKVGRHFHRHRDLHGLVVLSW